MKSAQVVVIGGGIIGASVTYYLAKQGVDVALCERGDFASGASGACSAAVTMQTKGSGLKLKLAMESRALYEHLHEDLGEDVEYEQEGGMIIAETDDELQYIRSLAKRQKEIGLTLELLTGREIRERQPTLSESVIAATYCALDGSVNPLKVNFAYIRAAKKHGADIYPFNRVEAINIAKGKVTEVTTDTGRIATGCVINAGGVWAPEIGRMVGVDVPIKPRRGILVVTEVVPSPIRGSILSAKYLMVKYADKAEGQTKPNDREFPGGLSIRYTKAGNLLFGSSREFVGFDTNITYEGISFIIKEALRLLPALRNVCIIRTFAGLRPFTPDGLPILGEAKRIEGFIMAAGHEGDGIALAPITGKLIANLITKRESPEALYQLNFQRFMQ